MKIIHMDSSLDDDDKNNNNNKDSNNNNTHFNSLFLPQARNSRCSTKLKEREKSVRRHVSKITTLLTYLPFYLSVDNRRLHTRPNNSTSTLQLRCCITVHVLLYSVVI